MTTALHELRATGPRFAAVTTFVLDFYRVRDHLRTSTDETSLRHNQRAFSSPIHLAMMSGAPDL
jgi:hypothetical protein